MQELTVRTIQTKGHHESKMLMWYLFAGSRGGVNRIRILSLLIQRPMNKHQISTELNLDYKAIRHHVKILEKNNMLEKFDVGYGTNYFTTLLFESNQYIFDEIVTKLNKL